MPLSSVRRLVALSLLALATTALAADPRPTILILGDQNTQPAGTGASWPQVIAKKHPDWNILVNADAKRSLAELASSLDKILAEPAHVEAVVLFTGTTDADAEHYAKADAAKLASQMTDLLKALKANPKTAKASLVLSTPMPIVESRLDKWSTTRFAGGEAHMKAIAEAYRAVAKDQSVTLVDFYDWAWNDKEADKPGKLLGTIGWAMRDWGHPIAARFFDEQLTKLNPAAPDAAAFAAWKAEQAASARLAEILSRTSEGTVAHGPALPWKAQTIAKQDCSVITIPPEVLAGPTLELVLFPTDKPQSAIGNGANLSAYRPRLSVTVAGMDKPIDITFPGGQWQLLDEATPDTAVDSNLYRWNASKMNYYGLTASEPGKRRWMLVRIPLDTLHEKLAGGKQSVRSAQVIIQHPAGLERFENNKATPIALDTLGHCTAALLTGPDTAWDDALATWKTRDGKIGWTGGTVDAPKRKAALEAFLKAPPLPPAPVAAEATKLLRALP